MNICLGIDASASGSSAAILINRKVAAEESAGTGNSGETLLTMVDRVVKLAGISLNDLTQIAVGIGPGSFTGIRNGIATAQGLSTGGKSGALQHLPVCGISSLVALAMPVPPSAICLVSFAANAEESFCAILCGGSDGSGIELLSGAFVLPQLEVKSYLDTIRKRFLTDQRSGHQLCYCESSEPRSSPSLAVRTAQASLFRVQPGSAAGDERGELFQCADGGRGLRPVYAKPVHAKTLLERGVQSLTSAGKLA